MRPDTDKDGAETNDAIERAEARLEALAKEEAWEEAIDLIGEVHGPMIRAMLIKKLRDESAAHEVWLEWYESVGNALPRFRWESRFSTWSYRIALNAFFGYKRRQGREALTVPYDPEIGQSDGGALDTSSSLSNRNYEATYDWVKTTNINHFRAICQDHLSEEDQALLSARLHQNRPWKAIARDRCGEDASPADLKREVQRLHVHFHRLVKRLHKLAVTQGLVSPAQET